MKEMKSEGKLGSLSQGTEFIALSDGNFAI